MRSLFTRAVSLLLIGTLVTPASPSPAVASDFDPTEVEKAVGMYYSFSYAAQLLSTLSGSESNLSAVIRLTHSLKKHPELIRSVTTPTGYRSMGAVISEVAMVPGSKDSVRSRIPYLAELAGKLSTSESGLEVLAPALKEARTQFVRALAARVLAKETDYIQLLGEDDTATYDLIEVLETPEGVEKYLEWSERHHAVDMSVYMDLYAAQNPIPGMLSSALLDLADQIRSGRMKTSHLPDTGAQLIPLLHRLQATNVLHDQPLIAAQILETPLPIQTLAQAANRDLLDAVLDHPAQFLTLLSDLQTSPALAVDFVNELARLSLDLKSSRVTLRSMEQQKNLLRKAVADQIVAQDEKNFNVLVGAIVTDYTQIPVFRKDIEALLATIHSGIAQELLENKNDDPMLDIAMTALTVASITYVVVGFGRGYARARRGAKVSGAQQIRNKPAKLKQLEKTVQEIGKELPGGGKNTTPAARKRAGRIKLFLSGLAASASIIWDIMDLMDPRRLDPLELLRGAKQSLILHDHSVQIAEHDREIEIAKTHSVTQLTFSFSDRIRSIALDTLQRFKELHALYASTPELRGQIAGTVYQDIISVEGGILSLGLSDLRELIDRPEVLFALPVTHRAFIDEIATLRVEEASWIFTKMLEQLPAHSDTTLQMAALNDTREEIQRAGGDLTQIIARGAPPNSESRPK